VSDLDVEIDTLAAEAPAPAKPDGVRLGRGGKTAFIRSAEGTEIVRRCRAAGMTRPMIAKELGHAYGATISVQLLDKLVSSREMPELFADIVPPSIGKPEPAEPSIERVTHFGRVNLSNEAIRLLLGREPTEPEIVAIARGRAEHELTLRERIATAAENASPSQVSALRAQLAELHGAKRRPAGEAETPSSDTPAEMTPTLEEVRAALRIVPGGTA
jgi:hypothetical protein